ncbi:hypothetical protein OAB90_00875 [bacterium]|jgi:hypothetical protein|nr:hypothetical protein [bacterium]|tara:strand:- start:2357 stop:2800 length:444 start_codon:yes stop_codon:yes gene_type:complete
MKPIRSEASLKIDISLFYKLIFLGLIVSLGACKQYMTTKRVNNIEAAVTSYDVAMRWAQYSEAYAYHVSPDGIRPFTNLDLLEELSVTGVKVIEKTLNSENTEAVVKIEISYYFKDEGTIKKLKLQQRWWVKEETNQWFIDGDFPKF